MNLPVASARPRPAQTIAEQDGLYVLSSGPNSPWRGVLIYGKLRYYIDLEQIILFKGGRFELPGGERIQIGSLGEIAPVDAGDTGLIAPVDAGLGSVDQISFGIGRTQSIEAPLSLIGRDPRCHFQVQDRSVSSVHCALLATAEGTIVFDARSRNGTRLNHRKLRIGQVLPNDTIEVGAVPLKLLNLDQSGPPPALAPLESAGFVEVERLVLRMARSAAPVAIEGETGVGKESIAEALHRYSARRGAFIALNAAVLGRDLASSALFGHKKGAFTGAVKDAEGAFVAAHKGTLFIDEVAELPLEVQAMLLRALESKEITPVGSAQSRMVDVRIVSATHKHLPSLISKGLFRSDLYHRLCVLPLFVPPLRERREDIATIIRHYLARQRPVRHLEPAAERMLLNYSWPGNIRELRNALQRACVISPNPVLSERDFELSPASAGASALGDIIRKAIFQSYHTNRKSIQKTADELGLHRTTVSRYLKAECQA